MDTSCAKYVPVIRWKAGEQGALKTIDSTKKKKFRPLIEVPPIPIDHASGSPAVTIDKHLEKVAITLEKCWGSTHLSLLDLLHISPAERMADGRHPLTFLTDEVRKVHVPVVPVTGLRRDPSHQEAVRRTVAKDKLGACVRVTLTDDGVSFGATLMHLVADLGLKPSGVDLVLDLETVDPTHFARLKLEVPRFIAAVPSVAGWRSISLVGGAFPVNLMGMSRGVQHLPRSEWALWRFLQRQPIPRMPTYGDYGIASPLLADVDPRTMNATASIRYTLEKEYMVVKGAGTRTNGYDQFHDQARTLVAEPDFRGASFSAGDELINSVAHRTRGPGNLTTWRQIGTNQHIEFVLTQV